MKKLLILFLLSVTLVSAATYTTRRGDTLKSVADRYGISVSQLATDNPNLKLTSGQNISVPTPPTLPPLSPPPPATYPLHTNITATVFWIGEPIGNGSSEDNAISAYDEDWQAHYGGYDDYSYRRTYPYFPNFTPRENPFYITLPFDDINNTAAYNWRINIPWYTGNTSKSYSYMKNRWVMIQKGTNVCYGQIEDAGPYYYQDSEYVFGTNDSRPYSTKANNAGLDVSPALRDCLGFNGLNNADNKVNWRFVDNPPSGPWTIVITTRQVSQ